MVLSIQLFLSGCSSVGSESAIATVKPQSYKRPYDVVAQYGRIYVNDIETKVIHVYDVPRRKYHPIGERGTDQLGKPMRLALERQSNLYVVDGATNGVAIFDFLGLSLGVIGGKGLLENPISVAVTAEGDRSYVVDGGAVDSAQHRMVVFNHQGDKLFEFG